MSFGSIAKSIGISNSYYSELTSAIQRVQKCMGHYGAGGDGAELVEETLEWCCNSCNCKDLQDKIECGNAGSSSGFTNYKGVVVVTSLILIIVSYFILLIVCYVRSKMNNTKTQEPAESISRSNSNSNSNTNTDVSTESTNRSNVIKNAMALLQSLYELKAADKIDDELFEVQTRGVFSLLEKTVSTDQRGAEEGMGRGESGEVGEIEEEKEEIQPVEVVRNKEVVRPAANEMEKNEVQSMKEDNEEIDQPGVPVEIVGHEEVEVVPPVDETKTKKDEAQTVEEEKEEIKKPSAWKLSW